MVVLRGKRAFDVLLGSLLLALSAVPLGVAAAAVRLQLGTPVLFRQERSGVGGRPFTLLKLRTMHHPSAPDGRELTDQERMTPMGSVLRRSSIDELPSLVNILRGDMSFIGPRPLPPGHYDHMTSEERRRCVVRPGLTGRAQVTGRNTLSWDERFRHDLDYIDQLSWRQELRILAATVPSVLGSRGITEPGSAVVTRIHDRTPNGSPSELT